jgi:hypothetical protein
MSGQINTGNIKAENKKISDDFINLIMDMFGVIDEVSEKIGDGKYLELANQFKKLSEFKEKMGTNIVYIEHEKRTQMRVLKPKERRLTYAEKLKDKKKYYKCHKCDCVLTRKEKPTHEKTQKCKKAYSSRMITLAKKTKVNSDTLIVLDDMLDTRRPYIMVETDDILEDKIKTEKRRLFTTEDYYSDDTENAVKVLQKRFRGRKLQKRNMGVEQKIDMSKLEIKWNYVKDLKEALNDDTRFKQLRLTTMFNFGFQIQGVKSMTNRQMFDMCIRALFISHKERNRPKMKGIKWVDRW